MHQTDRVLRQFRFRQPSSEEPEVLDEQYKINLWLANTNWPLFWLKYIKIWENRYDHIPDRKPIIVPDPMVGWNAWPSASPFLTILTTQPMIYRPSSPEGSHEARSTNSSHYHSLSPYGVKTLLPWVMQTTPCSLFYQSGSSS
ncbi:hypothetical protein PVK06_040493 [Gossypium arboreum]|uniref:Uncharacterized protein n=1 Tax=Gossypium arboreum TaxID=29729 RepID=A0ABR0N5M8_GOSAR|nr:hypothetical protein PVK06_040493 [Gossypium arboreum]